MIDYHHLSVDLLENCDEFLIAFLIEICREARDSNEISSFKIIEIYDALCVFYKRNFEPDQYEQDIERLVNQGILIQNFKHFEIYYILGDLPETILNFTTEFLKDVEKTKKFIRRFFSN